VNVTVRGFDRIDAYSTDGGQDEADIYDTAGDDRLEAADDWARTFNPDSDVPCLYRVLAFDHDRVHGRCPGLLATRPSFPAAMAHGRIVQSG